MKIAFNLLCLFSIFSTSIFAEGVNLKVTNNLKLSDKKTSIRLCEEKNYKECERAGKVFLLENDPQTAKKYFERACNEKLGTSCFQLSALNPPVSSKGGNKEGIKYLSQACDYNEYFSCYQLGKLMGMVSNNQEETSKKQIEFAGNAKMLMEKACKGKMQAACKVLDNNFKSYPSQLSDEVRDMCRAGIVEDCQPTK